MRLKSIALALPTIFVALTAWFVLPIFREAFEPTEVRILVTVLAMLCSFSIVEKIARKSA